MDRGDVFFGCTLKQLRGGLIWPMRGSHLWVATYKYMELDDEWKGFV